MKGRPGPDEAAKYYYTYIDRIQSEDVLQVLRTQRREESSLFNGISEEASLHRYSSDKWSIRQVLNHVNDCERMFLCRALWFARGLDRPLPSFDQDQAAAAALSDRVSWASHVQEFASTRDATVKFFENLPDDAWSRSGIASDNPVTVRALAYIIAGHLSHHVWILKERYL